MGQTESSSQAVAHDPYYVSATGTSSSGEIEIQPSTSNLIVAKKLAKKALVAILNSVAGDKIGECFDRLITFLVLKIKNELADEEDLAFTFDCIIFAVVGAGVEKAGENIGNVATGILGNAFAGISKAARNVIIDELGELVPFDSIVKIVILTVLYLAAHITVRYRKRRQIANVSNKTAKLSAKYESLPKEKNAQNTKIETQSEYVDELYDEERGFIGSSNQVVHFLTDFYSEKDFDKYNGYISLEVIIDDNSIKINGWPQH